jgi:hypothetical protein
VRVRLPSRPTPRTPTLTPPARATPPFPAMKSAPPRWSHSPARAQLLAVYAEVDALLAEWACACSRVRPGEVPEVPCCHFGVTGREPYPTAIELEEVHHAVRAAPPARRDPKRLQLVAGSRATDLRACPLLSPEGRCRIYASRPFGCRTFFCDEAEAPFGATRKLPRSPVNALGRRIADLSAKVFPRDHGPRPLVKALTLRP